MTSHEPRGEPDPAKSSALAVLVEHDRAEDHRAVLVIRHAGEAPPEPETPPLFDLCGRCYGPIYLCNSEGCLALESPDLLWLSAIRALMLGILLTPNVGSRYGGVLVLAARAMVGSSAPPHSGDVAALLPHPGYDVSLRDAAELAARYLHDGNLDALSRLSASLRRTNDSLLWRRVREAERAALSTPWREERFALLAVVCDACAGGRTLAGGVRGLSIPWSRRLEAAATYDAALRCPSCGALHTHPLPGVPIGLPHPVTRCTGGREGNVERCMVHDGGELGAEGVCCVGRPMLDQARAWGSDGPTIRLPWQRDLARALVQAQHVELERRTASGELVQALLGSAELRPFFAAAASLSPEIAEGLAQITGAPFEPEDVDPEAVEFLVGLRPLLAAAAKVGGVLTRLLRGGRQDRMRRQLPRAPR